MLESFANNIFTYKKLTEGEQQSRGILGRLVGVIADSRNPTRNGRQYGAKLWERVFEDPIMQEKIDNRCCFGELGHPADREEVDPEKIAICLAERPKMNKDGKLYGVFDILNTPCGKILKALCDYGTNIGVSSRGSGDIMANDEVDPDTYVCECWDAVLVPAVKAARQQYVTESLDTKAQKLKVALRESYDAASEDDKKVMKETLDNLNISLDEAEADSAFDLANIPEAEHEENFRLVEDSEKAEDAEEVDTADEAEVEVDEVNNDDVADDNSDKDTEEIDGKEDHVATDACQTVGDLIKELKDFDKDLNIEFKPIVIDEVEYPIEAISFDDSEEGKVLIEIGYNSEMSDNIDNEVEAEQAAEANDADVADDEITEEPKDDSEEAVDDGMDEVVESLKEMIRQKNELDSEVKSLKNARAVRDAEVEKLTEELNKYKAAFTRTSKIAAEAKEAKAQVQALTESLSKKETRIKELESVKANTVALTESANVNASKVKKLTEALASKQQELDEKDALLTEQRADLTKQLNERTAAAKAYKAKLAEAVNKYVESKAEMLGVKPTEITNRLNEKFSMNDIDKVCEQLLSESVSWGRLPINSSRGVQVKFNAVKNPVKRGPEYGYDIDDSLLELAGLK